MSFFFCGYFLAKFVGYSLALSSQALSRCSAYNVLPGNQNFHIHVFLSMQPKG